MLSRGFLPRRFKPFIATQALGAMNDNFFKTLLQLFVLQGMAAAHAEEAISQATLIFTVPFVLFGPWSGYLNDRYSKTKVMRAIKFLEIAIMLLGVLSYYYGNIHCLMGVLFLMATHSTFFSPAKSGIIPEICRPEAITVANSWVEMTTFIAILFGTAIAGPLLSFHHNNYLKVSIYCVGVAVLGTIASFGIQKTSAVGTSERFPYNPLSGIYRDLLFLKKQKGLFLASLANSYYWLLGLIFSVNILVYGKKFLGLDGDAGVWLTLLPAYLGIGIAAGSMLAGRWSGKKVELGLVPLGGIGLSVTGIALFFSVGSYWLTAVILVLAGIFGGLFIVPLYAFLQFEAKDDEKGRVLATAGVMNGIFLVIGSILYWLLAVKLAFNPAQIYLVMGILTILVVVYICTIIPEYFIRFIAWLMTHTFYNIKIVGAENVPLAGPAMLIPNHVSFVDALLLSASIQRFLKFVMYKKYFDVPVLRWLCKIMEVIPIAPYEGKESVKTSLETAQAKLDLGEIVCIFAEGKLTLDGKIGEFRPGFEKIMEGHDCPIIPVYLHNVWGSIFSYSGEKFLWKFPKKIPYPITIVYGEPMSPRSTAIEVETRVKAMAAEFAG